MGRRNRESQKAETAVRDEKDVQNIAVSTDEIVDTSRPRKKAKLAKKVIDASDSDVFHGSHTSKSDGDGASSSSADKPKDESYQPPKSKKQLRAERKAAARASQPKTESQLEEERRKQSKLLQKQKEKEQFQALLKQERLAHKERQQKRINRQRNSKGGAASNNTTKDGDQVKQKATGNAKKKKQIGDDGNVELDVSQKVIEQIKHGQVDSSSGWTTLERGVQFKDLVVGKGPQVGTRGLVTVKYKLTANGKFGNPISLDSSNKFQFRLGKSEVIVGWDIGIPGMCVGGRRRLIVPPKAGYGSQDIGAGPGAILHFDITLLAVRD